MNDKRIIIILIQTFIFFLITQNIGFIIEDNHTNNLENNTLVEVDQDYENQKLVTSYTRSTEPEITSRSSRKSTSWPMFLFDASRTGNGSSYAPKLDSILWSTPDVGGNGYPSVSVAHGTVYVNKGSSGELYALFENNGTIKWKKYIGISGSGSSTPAIANEKVYVVGDKLYCFDVFSGTEFWNQSVNGTDVGTSSPVVSNGKVFVNTWILYCIDANDGNIIWNRYVGGMGFSSPAVSDGKVVVHGNELYCFYTNNGTEIWNISSTGSNSPVIANGLIYHNPDMLHCLFLNNGTELWNQSEGGDEYSSPVIQNNRIFVNRFGVVHCYYSNNGTMIWNKRIGAAYVSPSLSNDGKLIIIGANSTNCVYQNNGTEIWNVSNEGFGYSSPAIANGRIFINLGTVYCIGPKGIDRASPIILSEYPKDQSDNISPFSQIKIRFNESMNKSATEAAFSISPKLNGSIQWDNESLIFEPEIHMLKSTKYKVTITTEAKDTSDNNLDGNGNGIFDGAVVDIFSYSFVTSERILAQIISTEPQNNSENVRLNSVINITFSDPMDHISTESAFSSSPRIIGSFEWASNSLTIIPDNPLHSDITYQITINTSAVDRIGKPLDGDFDGNMDGSPEDDYTWTFKTVEGTPPIVLGISPSDNSTDIPLDVTIRISFSEPMNRSSAETAFSITPFAQGMFLWLNETMEFKPIQELNLSTKYEIRISTLAKDLVGNTIDGNGNGSSENSSIDDYSSSFQTKSIIDNNPPVVQFTVPVNLGVNVDVWSNIVIHFSEPMNISFPEHIIKTEPRISGDFYWDDLGLEMSFVPKRYLPFDTQYTLTLDGTKARDAFGNTLDGNSNGISDGAPNDNYSWRFVTQKEPRNDSISPIVLFTNPLDGEVDVDIDTNIEISFNVQMNQTATETAFSISPSINGILIWENTTMIFQPGTLLQFDMIYQVFIDSSATDFIGNPLDGNYNRESEGSPSDDFSWEFKTINKKISNEFKIEIKGKTKIEITPGAIMNYSYTITNLGNYTNTIYYDIDVGTLNEHVMLEGNNFEKLTPQGKTEVRLILSIPENIELGNYDIIIIVTSTIWNISTTSNIELQILSPENGDDAPKSDISIFDQIFVWTMIVIFLIVVIIRIIVFRSRRLKYK
jgi:outer membrane protein assembly factor BamB